MNEGQTGQCRWVVAVNGVKQSNSEAFGLKGASAIKRLLAFEIADDGVVFQRSKHDPGADDRAELGLCRAIEYADPGVEKSSLARQGGQLFKSRVEVAWFPVKLSFTGGSLI